MEWENRNRAVLEASSDAFLIGFGRLFKGQDSIDGSSPRRTLATRQTLALMNAVFG